MSEKLKPCPFCGNKKLQLGEADDGTPMVWCECSGAASGGSKADAIKAWNRRPQKARRTK